jgi:hypothetical protein
MLVIRAFLTDQIYFVEQNYVGESKLFLCFVSVIDVLQQLLGVGNCDDGIKLCSTADFLVYEKSLGDGRGIGKPGRFE